MLQVRPKNTVDVVKIVNIARKYRVPIVPYGGATSLEGHFSGVDAIVSSTSKNSNFDSILPEVFAWTCLA